MSIGVRHGVAMLCSGECDRDLNRVPAAGAFEAFASTPDEAEGTVTTFDEANFAQAVVAALLHSDDHPVAQGVLYCARAKRKRSEPVGGFAFSVSSPRQDLESGVIWTVPAEKRT
ncbi:MAG: hypothetical protein ACR2PG_24105 [Hyphomicrobiaceae bacterium]